MRSAINVWAFPAEWPMPRVLALARDAGYEAIEPDYGPNGRLTAESTDAEARALRQQCLDAGLAISSLASGVFWQVNLLSDDDAERAEAKAHVRHMVRLGAALEVDTLLIVPGFVGPFEAGPPVIADYEATYERAVAAVVPTTQNLHPGESMAGLLVYRQFKPKTKRYQLDIQITTGNGDVAKVSAPYRRVKKNRGDEP